MRTHRRECGVTDAGCGPGPWSGRAGGHPGMASPTAALLVPLTPGPRLVPSLGCNGGSMLPETDGSELHARDSAQCPPSMHSLSTCGGGSAPSSAPAAPPVPTAGLSWATEGLPQRQTPGGVGNSDWGSLACDPDFCGVRRSRSCTNHLRHKDGETSTCQSTISATPLPFNSYLLFEER